jgi:RHS repeat-associated protein
MNAVYDPETRLLSLALAGTTSTYAYNGLGARVSKSQGSATTKYHYDHFGRLLFETDQSNKVIASYCYAGAVLVAMQTLSGTVYFYHFDKTGNTLALTDAAGNVANAYVYEPFGKVMTQTGTVRNPFTYVGAFGVMDEGNGIYYMKNRYYDASTGKFLQKDPIGFAGGQTNIYAYVGNNPVESIDPLGLMNGSEIPDTRVIDLLPNKLATLVFTLNIVRGGVAIYTGTLLGFSFPIAAPIVGIYTIYSTLTNDTYNKPNVTVPILKDLTLCPSPPPLQEMLARPDIDLARRLADNRHSPDSFTFAEYEKKRRADNMRVKSAYEAKLRSGSESFWDR